MEMVIMVFFMIAYMMNLVVTLMSMLHNKRGALAISGVVFAAPTSAVFVVPG